MKRSFKVVGITLAVIVLLAAVLVAVLSAVEYRPETVETIEVSNSQNNQLSLSSGDTLSMLAWNIGYCGLSDEADFFMDGGTSVQAVSKEGVRKNLANIKRILTERDTDVIFLQEVDRDSSRTYHIDEGADLAGDAAPRGYTSAFAYNYHALYVPYPIPPIGVVNSGIMTLSRYATSDGIAERIQLPCPFSWPVRTVNLKRCLLVERIPVAGDTDAELVLINLHLEAYDTGEGKVAQTEQLSQFMQAECEKGNYVIAGGDFNQSFSTVDTSAYPFQSDDVWHCGYLDAAEFSENFSLVMDAETPTCRSLDRPYDADDPAFQYYMIDGFIVSDNVRIETLTTIDTAFEYSDHNPVLMTATLL